MFATSYPVCHWKYKCLRTPNVSMGLLLLFLGLDTEMNNKTDFDKFNGQITVIYQQLLPISWIHFFNINVYYWIKIYLIISIALKIPAEATLLHVST